MFWYFDDTVQAIGGFVIGAFVVSRQDLAPSIAESLSAVGLQPGAEEFKSGSHMASQPKQSAARDHIAVLFHTHDIQVAIVAVPLSHRSQLGLEALKALKIFLKTNELEELNHVVYFDEGSFESARVAMTAIRELELTGVDIHWSCDSRTTLGLQAADLVAHSAGIMLLAELGLFQKSVKAGDHSGYDPETDISVDWELWASLRHNFMGERPAVDLDQDEINILAFRTEAEPQGLYVSDHCSPELAGVVRARFGSHYLGCVH